MLAIGLDIGTTTICAIVIDSDTGEIINTVTLDNDTFIQTDNEWEKIQDPRAILTKVDAVADELCAGADVGCIGVTGQMHGIVYLNASGDAISPLYIWQDGRGELEYRDGMTYSEYVITPTGYKVATGYGLVTHFYNTVNGLVPEGAVTFCTIHDYVAMKLAWNRRPVMNATDAASFGLYDLENNRFDSQAVAKLGMNPDMLPEISDGLEILGRGKQGVPVAVAIGDNQASFLGSVSDVENSLLVNVGTGSQISVYNDAFLSCPPSETRPYADKGFLLVGASLCGGRAYAIVENFFRQVVKMATGSDCDKLYAQMYECGKGKKTNALDVTTLFSGTRENPSLRGKIENIGIDNFTPGHFVDGVLRGIVEELYEMYAAVAPSLKSKPTTLVGSGNGIRKNKLLQELFSSRFNMELKIPAFSEEAAYGAALSAMVGVGVFTDTRQAQKIIKYQ